MLPADFVTFVKQINSQSDLIPMLTFAGLSYLAIRSSVYINLIWNPYMMGLIFFTITAKLDPIGNLTNVHVISMNK